MCNDEAQRLAQAEEAKQSLRRVIVARELGAYAMERTEAARGHKAKATWHGAALALEDIALQEFRRLLAMPRCGCCGESFESQLGEKESRTSTYS